MVVLPCLLLAPTASLGGERELWQLWQAHLAAPDDDAGAVRACRAYAAAGPGDPLLPVVRGIEAWRLLHAGRAAEAARLWAASLEVGGEPLERGAERLARAWITRLRRDQLAHALQDYYRREVRYPADLKALDALPDAWGRPWRYRLVGFDGVPGFLDQNYALESVSIQPPWDSAGGLAVPYGGGVAVRLLGVSREAQGAPIIRLECPGADGGREVLVGRVGGTVGGFYIAYAGQRLVILCDTLHWRVLPWTP